MLYPIFENDLRNFLKALISTLADNNILVFEFVETHNKKEKANIDGLFLNPNVIVLKRQQKSFRREIFTLVHELGHFLLNREEIEKVDLYSWADKSLSSIERWCNDFAYYFLSGQFDNKIESISRADSSNDYQLALIEQVSKNTHLSKVALFTRLLMRQKISRKNYNLVKEDFEEQFRRKQEEENQVKELKKQEGIKQTGSTPKPINSPLLISTVQAAFYEGIINEYDFCRTLNIKPEKLDLYLQ